MEDKELNNQDNAEIKTPRRRGRPPKSDSAKTQKSIKEQDSSANLFEDNQNNANSLDDIIDSAVKQRKNRRGRPPKVKREDGPKWIDAPTQNQESQPETDSEDESQLFVYQAKSDDFAYAKNSDENNSDEDIPTSFSTTDEDLQQDNYRNNYNNTTDDERLQEARDYENAVDNVTDENDSKSDDDVKENSKQRYNRNDRQSANNRNQNRNQKRDKNNRYDKNQQNRQQNNQNQQNRQQQGNNQQNQNRNQQGNNQQNRQQNQNRQQQGNNQQNRQQNQQNKNLQRQKRQSWLQNYSVEGDVINPADLPEWDILLNEVALTNYLSETFLGKSITVESEKVKPQQEEQIQVQEVEDVKPQADDLFADAQDSKESEVQETQEVVEEVVELPKKDIADMNYWELMVNANDTAVKQLGLEKAQPKEVVETVSEEEISQEEQSEQIQYQEPTTLNIEGVGEIEILADFEEIYNASIKDIQYKYSQLGIRYKKGVSKTELVCDYLKYAFNNKKLVKITGVLDVFEAEFGGALTYACDNFRLKKMSVYISKMLIEKYALKRGHIVSVLAMPPRECGNENCPIAVAVTAIMGEDPQKSRNVINFTDLVPYYPTRRIILESDFAVNADKISMRAVDLLSPIGFGQRALLVAPPRTGKTVLMQGIAKSIRMNEPNAKIIILLVDERPEEVTDFKRNVDAEVIASTFDEDATNHVHAAEMVISKARRMVEYGQDVVILLDSITRLARAYNALMPNGGRTMSGGVEANALQKPKKFFGSARNIEGGGSLTIIGTALVETGSKMDEVIFEEFKGTGNLELVLDRGLSDKRIFPAINIEKSGTRKEELLYHPDEMQKIYALRRAMKGVPTTDAMEMLAQRLKRVKTNIEFLMGLNR